jgi:hypothetical protein
MALTEKQIKDVTAAGEGFLEKRRPPVEIRSQLDLAYRIQGQSVLVYELRPGWNNPAEINEEPVAKTTFVKTQNHWKVYWMRADLKWHSYSPKPTVKTIQAFFKLVDDDSYACFFG